MQRDTTQPFIFQRGAMHRYRLPLAALCLAAAGLANADNSAPSGRWLTASGNLEVEIAACGQDLCGTVVKVIANRAMGGPPAAPGASASKNAARPLLGLTIMPHFTAGTDGQWTGRIYNRERDASYDCTLALAGPDQIRLSIQPAPLLPPAIQFWRRVAGPGPAADRVSGQVSGQ